MIVSNEKLSRRAYIVTVLLIALALLAGYIPPLAHLANIATPPAVLLAGLLYALVFGCPYKKFNKKASKLH